MYVYIYIYVHTHCIMYISVTPLQGSVNEGSHEEYFWKVLVQGAGFRVLRAQ